MKLVWNCVIPLAQRITQSTNSFHNFAKQRNHFGRVLPANARTDEAIVNVRRTDLVRKTYKESKGLSRFRQYAYAAWFIAFLKASVLKGKGNRPSSAFLFGIILKEIVASLQRLYLNPSGNIYPVMTDIIGPQAYDLSVLVDGGRGVQPLQRDRNGLIQILSYVLENIIYHITEIMPKTGVLGTHRKSAVFELIKTNRRFPDGYFWQVELDRLQFNENGRTINVGNNEAFFLIVGIYLSRSLITTLLLKPIDYGLSTDALNDVNYRNLKVLSSILLFVIRRVSVPRGQPMMPIPGEIVKHVHRDEEMKNVHISLKKSYEYCENLLREWGAEYVKRLRVAADSTSAPQPPLKPER